MIRLLPWHIQPDQHFMVILSLSMKQSVLKPVYDVVKMISTFKKSITLVGYQPE